MNICKSKNLLSLVLLCSSLVSASNLANPGFIQPPATMAIGASYHLGGYTLTNQEIPSLFNRYHARISFAPFSFLSLGLDAGAIQIDVDKYSAGTINYSLFHGQYGYSAGAHLKLATPPFINKLLAVIVLGQGTAFNSENSKGAYYKGYDGCGTVGIQFRIKDYGFITLGPQVYIIEGENSDTSGNPEFYSNINNVRGLISFDFLPVSTTKKQSVNSYISVELAFSPAIEFGDRVPIKEFSVSVAFGVLTNRLYGNQ